MDDEIINAGLRLLASAAIGGAIGLERAYNGRAAGFRTHILVCIASALLMLLMDFQWATTPAGRLDSITVDPTRMAQGIMTGIGFLGAGVILHNRRSVRGLTTAASIWITSALGIILGAGHFLLGAIACLLALLTLSVFRCIEQILPSRRYARLVLTANSSLESIEERLINLMKEHEVGVNGFAYSYQTDKAELELQTTISTFKSQKFSQLEKALIKLDELQSFKLTPLDN